MRSDLGTTLGRPGSGSAAMLRQRLVGLFALALLLFNFPLLALWDVEATIGGVPLFPAALFLIWALLIAALAAVMERRS